jgi:hypothetical protein
MTAPNPYAPPSDGGPLDDVKRDANWALVLGIGSVFFCAPITAPLAVWRGVRASRSGFSAKAAVGIGFAAFGLLTAALFWFLAIWQFLSPGPPPASP